VNADAFHVLSRIIGRVLDDLDVVARQPVQGMAMHKVIAARLIAELPADGYAIAQCGASA
jgi:hypothetical protein